MGENGTPAPVLDPGFTISHQRIYLDIDFKSKRITGKTDITINPLSVELKTVRLRLCQATLKKLSVSGKGVTILVYHDPYKQASLGWDANVHQYHMLQEKIEKSEGELVITIPKGLRIYELDDEKFTQILIRVEFVIETPRDGIHFEENEFQYPHVYTTGSLGALFPCADMKCPWEISIRTPRTIGDAVEAGNYKEEDRALDLVVVCSGDVTDEIVDAADPANKTTSFLCASALSPRHIGFVIGPFEYVNLAAFRESDEDEKLGKNAVPIYGFCLPGRVGEVTNTCLPIARAMDFIVTTYGSYPYSSYKICFVDGLISRIDTATLSICSSRLLFPEDIIDTMDSVTQELIYGLACQWVGVDITPNEPTDLWAVVGMAYYITDTFLRKLSGNNEYRFSQTKAAEQLCTIDVSRPSMFESGRYVDMDQSHMDLIVAKAPLVLYILDRRLTKTSGSTGLSRIISRVLLNANVGDLPNGAISTAYFMRLCERLGHTKLDIFFNQWVMGAGCPKFRVTQRFNKKRLVVEMQIMQVQSESTGDVNLDPINFMRDVKEDYHSVWAGPLQPVFTGPMTIRIHEADGTPYEHIVEIKEAITRFEIPYNTKYKRLKRSRRHREEDDALLYCLGDVLQSPEEEADWRLSNWTKEDEERMSGESYEWIRMDADFEWICRMTINMPGYMFVSQLQQDRDVSAQYETIQYLASQKPLPLVSTILVRTLMDKRYFHGIRTAAAMALAKHAKEEVNFVGLHHLTKAYETLYCFSESSIAKANDFTDRASYYVQCAILRTISQVGESKDFLHRKLRENDNSGNEYSDCYYVALLMRGTKDYGYEEIDRHHRIDEWIPSYHNVLTIAALDCAKDFDPQPKIFLQYTQEGTSDDLRIAAFSDLLALDFLKDDYILRWFLFVLGYDPSPYIRSHMFRLFGEFLGKIALDENETSQIEDLIIEQSSTDDRQAMIARKQTVMGALSALKVELAKNECLKRSLWDAICSPALSITELGDLLNICDLLYEPETSMTIVLKYPRYFSATNVGRIPAGGGLKAQHLVRFTPTSRVRTAKMGPKWKLPDNEKSVFIPPLYQRKESRPQLVLKLPRKPGLILKGSMPPPSNTASNGSAASPETPGEEGRPRLKLKLKLPQTRQ